MKYIVDGNNLEELQIVVREPHGKDRIIEFKGDTNNLVQMSDVNLYDWDGTLLFSYTKDNFLKMTDYPTVAAPEGMTVQGWNWSFENAKAYVEKYGMVNVGRMCYPILPEEKKHALLMEMHIPEDGLTDIPLVFSQSVSNGVEIDWGDGSEIETVEGTGVVTTSHQYPSDNAIYTIAVKALDGCEIQYGDGANQKNIFGGIYNTPAKYYGTMINVVSIIFPEEMTEIDDYAFVNCQSIESLIIPKEVITIGNYAFHGCLQLKVIVIPKNTINVGECAFYGSISAQSIVISERTTSIGNSAFSSCNKIKSLTIPEGMTNIENGVFSSCCTLRSLIIPEGVTSIGSQAFSSCYVLQSITIPEGVTDIGSTAFYNAYGLKSLIIPNGVTNIGTNSFSTGMGNAIRSLIIREGAVNIGQQAFRGFMSIRSLVIPEGVTSIGRQAFLVAVNLSTVTISSSVQTIGAGAFYACCSLISITMNGQTPPTLGDATVFEKNEGMKIYVPYSEDHSVLNAYKAATNWSTYADYIFESEPIETEAETEAQ